MSENSRYIGTRRHPGTPRSTIIAVVLAAIVALALVLVGLPALAAAPATISPRLDIAQQMQRFWCVDTVDDATTAGERLVRESNCSIATRELADARAVEPTTPAPTATPSASSTPTATPTPTPTPTQTGTGPAKLRAADGGPNWYAQFYDPISSEPTHFPIGVWFESVTGQSDVDKDRAAGLNTYVQLTANSNFALARSNGMTVISNAENSTGTRQGWNIGDEVDMTKGEAGSQYLVDVMKQLPNDGRLRYTNVAKGALFWQTDENAAKFLNLSDPYTGRPVLVSYDAYWFTDNSICQTAQGGRLLQVNRALTSDECHRAYNYGLSVDRLRSLDRAKDPVWGFVELGHPFTEGDWPSIAPAQVRAAVWSNLIHGARGIIYFNHSFGGPCQTQHALRENCYAAVRAEVTRTNAQVKALAPVLNGPFVDGVMNTSGVVDASLKYSDGSFYILSGSKSNAGGQGTFNLPCVGTATATVIDENRTIPIVNGTFSDAFANGDAVHLYRVDGGGRCGLPA